MGHHALERLVDLGALDVECTADGGVAALMPDSITPDQIALALGVSEVSVSPALGRDDGSVWILSQRPARAGRFHLVPASAEAGPNTIRLIDAPAFGTGLHPTTALCLEALEEAVEATCPDAMLDVGTGSGVLALAALSLGVPRATGIDIDESALAVASENARINGVAERLQLVRGGPDVVAGAWPLIMANVLAGPLIEMASALARRLGHQGQIVLSGIPASVAPDVRRAYCHVGLNFVRENSRRGWVALVLRAGW